MVDIKKGVQIIVHGRVQKVGFRKFIFEKAIELSITGSVKNQSDGTVIIFASGTNLQIDELLLWCQKGSPMAKVDKIDVSTVQLKPTGNFKILK